MKLTRKMYRALGVKAFSRLKAPRFTEITFQFVDYALFLCTRKDHDIIVAVLDPGEEVVIFLILAKFIYLPIPVMNLNTINF